MKKTTLVLTLIFFSIGLVAQNDRYSKLDDYKKYGWVIGISRYDKAINQLEFGTKEPINLNALSYKIGLNYTFNPDQKWTLISGALLTQDPVYSLNLQFDKAELNDDFIEPQILNSKRYSYIESSIEFPFIAQYQVPAFKNGFVHVNFGLKTKFISYVDKDPSTYHFGRSPEEILFTIETQNTTNNWQSSFLLSTGVSLARKKYLLRADLSYTVNFQNVAEGTFNYSNLLVTSDSQGSYHNTGNHLSLLITIHFLKRKKKLEHINDNN